MTTYPVIWYQCDVDGRLTDRRFMKGPIPSEWYPSIKAARLAAGLPKIVETQECPPFSAEGMEQISRAKRDAVTRVHAKTKRRPGRPRKEAPAAAPAPVEDRVMTMAERSAVENVQEPD